MSWLMYEFYMNKTNNLNNMIFKLSGPGNRQYESVESIEHFLGPETEIMGEVKNARKKHQYK